MRHIQIKSPLVGRVLRGTIKKEINRMAPLANKGNEIARKDLDILNDLYQEISEQEIDLLCKQQQQAQHTAS